VYRRINFSWCEGDKEFTQRVINVTFKYSVKEYNRVSGDVYIKAGHNYLGIRDRLTDCALVENGELIEVRDLLLEIINAIDEFADIEAV